MQTLRADAYASALFCCPGRDKLSARTCKKLPVASFCASETAETGRIANGREQGDHVSRRRGGEKARGAAKDLIGFVRSCSLCALIRGLQNLESPFWKGFNFVRAKPPLRRAKSRFGKPRSFLQGSTDLFFSLVRKEPKVPQRFANLWTPGTIQISARFKILAKMAVHHHVTGRTGDCKVSGYRR